MIDAKNKFREGFIMLLRPFKFAELKNPLQKLTILWAYSEQPIIKRVLTSEAKNECYLTENVSGLGFMSKEHKKAWIEEALENLFNSPTSYENLYEGDIVQSYVDGQLCRFYPDEYKILTKERLFEIMQEEGYHVIISEELKLLKEFKDKSHYLKSRGISQKIADKWSSLSFGSMVIYKPYFELLNMFCRDHEIYEDEFYTQVEGINFSK